jgi:HD-GYP domain-containing protein (c-di-GMP phosphodiesterase class II)
VRQTLGEAGQGVGPVPGHRHATWFDAWEQQVWALDKLLRDLGKGACRLVALEAVVDEQLRLVVREPDAALFQAIRQDGSRCALYGLTHALHTATVAVLAAQVLGWPAARIRGLAMAALSMNASILDLQAQMAEQSDPPSKRQIDLIRSHPRESARLLRTLGVPDLECIGAVEDHHERAGGGGYPQGLATVTDMPRVLRAADVFAAKISPRALREPLRAQVAARQLFQEEAGSVVAAALIKAVGVYPPGEFVQLRNGETAVVTRRTDTGNAPEAVVLLTAQGRVPHDITRRQTAEPEFAIQGIVPDCKGLPRVLPERVYGLLSP